MGVTHVGHVNAAILPDWMLIGLISDTHGLLRPGVLQAFDGVEMILHAGDVGGNAILGALSNIAPVRAVAGNVDATDDPGLEKTIDARLGGIAVHVSHGHELGTPTPVALLARYPATVVVFGHTHRAIVHRAGDRLAVNPGAAGPRRFDIKPSVALMTIERGRADVRIVWL